VESCQFATLSHHQPRSRSSTLRLFVNKKIRAFSAVKSFFFSFDSSQLKSVIHPISCKQQSDKNFCFIFPTILSCIHKKMFSCSLKIQKPAAQDPQEDRPGNVCVCVLCDFELVVGLWGGPDIRTRVPRKGGKLVIERSSHLDGKVATKTTLCLIVTAIQNAKSRALLLARAFHL
jgi:hypothetical protein